MPQFWYQSSVRAPVVWGVAGTFLITCALLFFGFKMRSEYRETESGLSTQINGVRTAVQGAENHIIQNQNDLSVQKRTTGDLKAQQVQHEKELHKVETVVKAAVGKK